MALLVLGIYVLINYSKCAAAETFSFESVQEKARALAAKDYQQVTNAELPDYLKKLSYDAYKSILFLSEKSVWKEESLHFTLQFFHPGFIYSDPVTINLVERGQAHELKFSADQFEYGTNRFPKPLPAGIHFAGLKVLYPLNSPYKQDEVASFIGASYFRLLGVGQRYGSSARGLAINTAEPSGEEFPRFTEFWVEKPDTNATHLEMYALMNSPSLAGAYHIVLKPGETTMAEIEAHLYLRKQIIKIGISPLTSMFWKGSSHLRFIPDFRPEVHDSDGLSMQIGAEEWLWRPLINPEKQFHISPYPWQNARGFGLVQRERDFRAYEDLESRYELRSSLWVEPRGKWNEGTVELVEIPTANEFNDNVVAYWVPKEKFDAGRHLYYSYILSAFSNLPKDDHLSRILATRISPPHDQSPMHFVIDFSDGMPSSLAATTNLTAKIQLTKGEARNVIVQTNEVAGGWRTFFDFVAGGNDPSELRLFLQSGGRRVSETWVYNYLTQ